MNCLQIQKLLHAYIDSELPESLSEQIQKHLEICSACSKEVKELKQLFVKLNTLPEISSPASLTPSIITAFRTAAKPSRMCLYWPLPAFYRNKLTCGMAVTGFLIGLLLGCSLLSLPGGTPDYSQLLAYTDMEGIFGE